MFGKRGYFNPAIALALFITSPVAAKVSFPFDSIVTNYQKFCAFFSVRALARQPFLVTHCFPAETTSKNGSVYGGTCYWSSTRPGSTTVLYPA